jgi:hypothetical protein
LIGEGALAGTAAAVFDAVGDLYGALPGEIIGSAAIAFAGSGELTGAAALGGTCSLTFAASGDLTDASAVAPEQSGGRQRRRIKPEQLPPIRAELYFLQPWQEFEGRAEVSSVAELWIEQVPGAIVNATAESSDDVVLAVEQGLADFAADLAARAIRQAAAPIAPVFEPVRGRASFEQSVQEFEAMASIE